MYLSVFKQQQVLIHQIRMNCLLFHQGKQANMWLQNSALCAKDKFWAKSISKNFLSCGLSGKTLFLIVHFHLLSSRNQEVIS